MLKLAMPEADLKVTTAGQLAVLTGTVASPDDGAQAEQLVKAMLNPGIDISDPKVPLKMQVISRLRTATPLQVNLQVKIAEVSREFGKTVGFNLLTRDMSGGFLFGLATGRLPGTITDITSPTQTDSFGRPLNIGTSYGFTSPRDGVTSLHGAGKLFGLDILGALDLAENDGLVTTLANPNLTALSGETASFLAGGEIPIPLSQQLGQVTVEYKQYGVSLSFTPTVLADGRISMRVRPEVSELSEAGSVTLNDFVIPGIITRRAETTVELGSGQSFVIGGLLRNATNNSMDKAPFLGDLPILGALFRSKSWRRAESELVIVVTPYLVKPVSANQISLPTDGLELPNDAETFLMDQTFKGRTGAKHPSAKMGQPQTVAPGIGPSAALPAGALKSEPAQSGDRKVARAQPNKSKGAGDAAKPGFSLN
jgi:pilus assembly protein CpaC